jgi:hypothetical protein
MRGEPGEAPARVGRTTWVDGGGCARRTAYSKAAPASVSPSATGSARAR